MNRELAGHHLRNVRRAWAGANLCRGRLNAAHREAPTLGDTEVKVLQGQPTHDVDYYAWESVRILNIANRSLRQGFGAAPRWNTHVTNF
jgi:hypothetical protein